MAREQEFSPMGAVRVSGIQPSISQLPTGITGYIQLIWTQHDSIEQIIYDRDLHEGDIPAYMPIAYLPLGASYEVHVEVYATSNQAFWAQAVTLRVAGTLSNEIYRTQCGIGNHDRYLTSRTNQKLHGSWNMGVMVEQPGIVNFVGIQIKHWLTDYYTTSEPPEEEW